MRNKRLEKKVNGTNENDILAGIPIKYTPIKIELSIKRKKLVPLLDELREIKKEHPDIVVKIRAH